MFKDVMPKSTNGENAKMKINGIHIARQTTLITPLPVHYFDIIDCYKCTKLGTQMQTKMQNITFFDKRDVDQLQVPFINPTCFT